MVRISYQEKERNPFMDEVRMFRVNSDSKRRARRYEVGVMVGEEIEVLVGRATYWGAKIKFEDGKVIAIPFWDLTEVHSY